MTSNTQELISEGREGQTVEFKQSLASGLQNEAIDALVAFANTSGGSVVFGVADDGRVVGADVSGKTEADVARRIKDRAYPQLPVEIHTVVVDGKTLLRVDAFPDKPPLIGVYLRSKDRLSPDEPVIAERLQAFRRVGSTNQKWDFMLLRESSASDPDVVLRRGTGMTRGPVVPKEWGYFYSNSGGGWAYGLSLSAIHPTLQFSTSSVRDLSPAARPRTTSQSVALLSQSRRPSRRWTRRSRGRLL